MPQLVKKEHITTHPSSDLRQLEIQHNNIVTDLMAAGFGLSVDAVLAWSSAISASAKPLGRGSTDTAIGSGAFRFIITGQAATEAKAAVAAGTAIGAQTVPADTWAVYSLDIATGGTITVTAGAANATTGYASEAAAIAACPARVTAKARMGYITVKTASGLAWIAATDGLAGGSSGNVASITNYYPFYGVFGPTGVPADCSNANGQWNGGFNGILIPSVLSRGSSDTNVATTAFTFNANGCCNIAKAAVSAGTAFTALTVPADKWGLWAMLISTAGTITYLAAPGNNTGDYSSEGQAIGALPFMSPTAGNALIGYVTVKTKAATAWIAGTDGLAGGSSGNVASATNYYPTTGVMLPTSGVGAQGILTSQLAPRSGVPLTSANY